MRRVLPRSAPLAALLVSGLFGGCGDGVKTFDELPSRVEVEPGDRFAIDLTINPSIGWTWDLSQPPPAAVELEDTEVEIDDPESDGSGGTKRFVFEAVEVGTGELRFERDYRGEKIDDRHTVEVEVR